MSTTQYNIECLRKDIEKKIGRSIDTYSDFNYLSLKLSDQIPDPPSISTLKRLWNYVSDSSSRSRSTLNALSRFLGYADWSEYVTHLMRDQRAESEFLHLKTMSADSLFNGDRIEMKWNPDREMTVEYLGDRRFKVIEVKNGKLKPGMTFTAGVFLKGMPLICDNVYDGDLNLGAYTAGTGKGLTSLRLLPSSN